MEVWITLGLSIVSGIIGYGKLQSDLGHSIRNQEKCEIEWKKEITALRNKNEALELRIFSELAEMNKALAKIDGFLHSLKKEV